MSYAGSEDPTQLVQSDQGPCCSLICLDYVWSIGEKQSLDQNKGLETSLFLLFLKLNGITIFDLCELRFLKISDNMSVKNCTH